MDRVRERLQQELPQVAAYFQSGGLVDADLEPGLAGAHGHPGQRDRIWSDASRRRRNCAARARALPGVSDVLVPQDVDYPALQLDIDRERASELGLNEKEVVGNVITALTSDGMIAPSYWVDPRAATITSSPSNTRKTRSKTWRTCRPFHFARRTVRDQRAWIPSATIATSNRRPRWTIINCGG